MNSSSKLFQTIVDFKYISTSVHVEEEDISMLWKIKKKMLLQQLLREQHGEKNKMHKEELLFSHP